MHLAQKQARPLQPTRLRDWFALLAIFLGLIAQTVHTHPISGKISEKAGFHALGTSNENPDLCPLCIAMHSTQPAPSTTGVSVHFASLPLLLPEVEEATSFPPAFTHFSRPPPPSTR